jgi:hypothetical protein
VAGAPDYGAKKKPATPVGMTRKKDDARENPNPRTDLKIGHYKR